MTNDERKCAAILLWAVAFVLGLPALFGIIDAWLAGMHMAAIWAWDGARIGGIYLCSMAAALVTTAAIVTWPKQ